MYDTFRLSTSASVQTLDGTDLGKGSVIMASEVNLYSKGDKSYIKCYIKNEFLQSVIFHTNLICAHVMFSYT